MRKTFLPFFSMLLFTSIILSNSCKKEEGTVTAESSQITNEVKDSKITNKDIEALDYIEYVLSERSEQSTRDWLKFQELRKHIDDLKKGDLSFFKEEKTIIQEFTTELESQIPESLNDASINARLVALKTTIYKLHDDATLNNHDKKLLLISIKETLIAQISLIFQINKKFEKDGQQIKKPTN